MLPAAPEPQPPSTHQVATAAAGLEAGHGLASVLKHNALMEAGLNEYTAGGPKGLRTLPWRPHNIARKGFGKSLLPQPPFA